MAYQNHYDQDVLAELYDHIPLYAQRADIGFYRELCHEAKGPVLELGCGTGRILLPAAADGTEMVGLDLSRSMLARCREKISRQPLAVQKRITLHEGSMTGFNLGRKFPLIIIPFRPFLHLVAVEDQLACLACCREHLLEQGVLAIDFFQVNLNIINDPHRAEEKEDTPEIDISDGRRLRRCSRIVTIHRAEQYNDVEMIYYLTDAHGKTERIVQAFPFRYFFRYEVEHLLARSGFRVKALYGNFDRSTLADASPEMIFLAQPEG